MHAPVTVRFFIVRRSTVNFNLNCCPCLYRQRSKQALERGRGSNDDHDSDVIKSSDSQPWPLRCEFHHGLIIIARVVLRQETPETSTSKRRHPSVAEAGEANGTTRPRRYMKTREDQLLFLALSLSRQRNHEMRSAIDIYTFHFKSC